MSAMKIDTDDDSRQILFYLKLNASFFNSVILFDKLISFFRQKRRKIDKDTNKQRETELHKETDRHKDGESERQTERQKETENQTERQRDRVIAKQKDKDRGKWIEIRRYRKTE